jgi:hypothetical protein
MPGYHNIGYYSDGLFQCIMNHKAAVKTGQSGILAAYYLVK